ncbi:MAG: hypothetical protein ACO3XO_05395 [Bdellovibrionota bacterium]
MGVYSYVIQEGAVVREMSNQCGRLLSFLSGSLLALVVFAVVPTFTSSRFPLFSLSLARLQVVSLLYEREVLLPKELLPFRGIIEEQLPWERSNVSWLLFPSRLNASLETIPLLRAPKVQRCSWLSIACFAIVSELREPVAVVRLKDKKWLVDAQAEYLLPVSYSPASPLPTILGLELFEHSPERLRVATARLLMLVDSFRQWHDEPVSKIAFIHENEIRISFQESAPTLLLRAEQLSKERLRQMGERMQTVMTLEALRARDNAVIDLRFKGMAVVKAAPEESSG